MENNILYEDNHIIVCLKKALILSQEDHTKKPDMVNLLKNYLKEKYDKKGNVYLGLVHRLDLRVSGVMVFAKTSKAAKRLSEQIKQKEFKKTYTAVVVGDTLKYQLLTNKLEKKDLLSVESEDGKECILEYTKINNFTLDSYIFSVLDINLITGRFNQIRKQLSLINHPIINDFKYNYRLKNYNDTLGLVESSLSFKHPITSEVMIFKKPVEYNSGWEAHLERNYDEEK